MWTGPVTFFSPVEYGKDDGVLKMLLKSRISCFMLNDPGWAWLNQLKMLKEEVDPPGEERDSPCWLWRIKVPCSPKPYG